MTEQEFRLQADRALEGVQRALLPLADQEGFEVELQNGVLQVVFEDPSPAKFVVSPNAPSRSGCQRWRAATSSPGRLIRLPSCSKERRSLRSSNGSRGNFCFRRTRGHAWDLQVFL